jgi:hypothetical protein
LWWHTKLRNVYRLCQFICVIRICASYFQIDCLSTKPQAQNFLKTIDSYLDRNYVSWNLDCCMCTDGVKSKISSSALWIRSIREGFALGRMTVFIEIHLGWNQRLRTERCAKNVIKLFVNCIQQKLCVPNVTATCDHNRNLHKTYVTTSREVVCLEGKSEVALRHWEKR